MNFLEERNLVMVKYVETVISHLYLDENGIRHMIFKDEACMDVPEQMLQLKGLIDLTDNKGTPFLITAGENVSITPEAKENALKIERVAPIMIASALVTDKLAYRLVGNFYVKVKRPKFPLKIFSQFDPAYAWLNSHKISR